MACGKVVTLSAPEPGVGRRTLARHMAAVWSGQGKQVIWVDTDHPAPHPDPSLWVSRFQSLSAQMLRHFLAHTESRWGELRLRSLPRNEEAAPLFKLLRAAYDVVLVVAPVNRNFGMPVLFKVTDMILWIDRSNLGFSERFDNFRARLSADHFPHAFAHPIQAGTPSAYTDSTIKCLARLPHPEEQRASYQTEVHDLVATIDARPDLARDASQEADERGVSDAVVAQLKEQVHPALLKAMEIVPSFGTQETKAAVEACIAKDVSLPTSTEVRGKLIDRVLQDVLGFGPIDPLLGDPDVSEVMVNGSDVIYVEKKGCLSATDIRFSSEDQLRAVIDRIVSPLGRRVDESMPICDARLPDGSRVNVILPPLALNGPTLTIRKFSARALTLPELVERESMSPAMADYLVRAVRARRNIIVSGGTGSGKTTLLNALSGAVPDEERIVTIEDAAELRLQKPHVVRLESRPPNAEGAGAISIRRLVMNALRMRPDRIVVGECRGGEALDMLQAMNTGHDGSMTTLHANSPRDALGRLETLVLMAGVELPVRVVREQIRSAVQVILQVSRLPDGRRKLVSVTEITGMEGDVLSTFEVFRFHQNRFEIVGNAHT